MPEGDTIYRAARTLHRALAGKPVTRFETVLPKLARVDEDSVVSGRTIERVDAQGKWLLIHFSGDLTLLTHMLMSGSWHIYRPGEAWKRRKTHMRVVIGTESMIAVAFNVPIAEFHTAESLRRRDGFRSLGPSVLSKELDGATILANLRAHPEMEIGAALLEQSLLAGVGNVFKSEVCFGSGVNPFRRIETLSIAELSSLVATAREFMTANIAELRPEYAVNLDGLRRTTESFGSEERLWVYGRHGKACRRCGAEIEVRRQQPGARVTFWCPVCQPVQPSA
jgi:endonuclease VIII